MNMHEFMKEIGWNIVNFIMFVGLMAYLLKKPLGAFFENKSKALKSAIDEARRRSLEAERQFKEYETKLGRLGDEIALLRREVEEQAGKEKDKIVEAAARQMERLRLEAQKLLENELRQAERLLQRQIGAAAVDQAAALLQNNLKPEDKQKFDDRLLEDLKRQAPKGTT